MSFVSIKEGIEELKKGNMLIMLDAEDRENEGDIIFPAEFSTPDKVNFTLTHARGVVCVALDRKIAEHFELPLMVPKNTSNHETAFTITVDIKTASTGVSSIERDATIKLFADKNAKASDFVRPGHINPLIAKDGGVLVRTGHTEGTVDMCKLAGLTPACVICEIMNPDGTMARRDDLVEFGKKHNIKLVTIEDLIKYRLQNESLITKISEENTKLLDKEVKKITYKDFLGDIHTIFSFAGKNEKSLIKFYKSSNDVNILNSTKLEETLKSIDELSKNGGMLVFMEGTKSDEKNYGIGAQILKDLGVDNFELLGNSSQFAALSGFGLNIKNI